MAKKTKKGFVGKIEKDTVKNKDFRRVLYTGKFSQLVLMNLKPGEEIGEEVHDDVDQFFRFEEGKGLVVIDDVEHEIKDGMAVVVPSGAKHNVITPPRRTISSCTPSTRLPSTRTRWSVTPSRKRWTMRSTTTGSLRSDL
jgi:mannose-6-phosphate isomerase-like protein (cupin superfamily)